MKVINLTDRINNKRDNNYAKGVIETKQAVNSGNESKHWKTTYQNIQDNKNLAKDYAKAYMKLLSI